MIIDFPILFAGGIAKRILRQHPDWPRSIPVAMLARHERLIENRFGATIKALAKAGGLPARELLAILLGQDPDDLQAMTLVEAMTELVSMMQAPAPAPVEPELGPGSGLIEH